MDFKITHFPDQYQYLEIPEIYINYRPEEVHEFGVEGLDFGLVIVKITISLSLLALSLCIAMWIVK